MPKGIHITLLNSLDLNGRLLKSDKAFGSNFKLDISNIGSGVYMILLQNNEEQAIECKRLVKD